MNCGEHPTSNIERPPSKGGPSAIRWMLDVGCWMLDVGCWMFGLSINRVAADVSPLTYHPRSLSRLTSAATSRKRFMVPVHAQKRKGAFHGRFGGRGPSHFCAVAERLFDGSRGLQPTESWSGTDVRRGATLEPKGLRSRSCVALRRPVLPIHPRGLKPTANLMASLCETDALTNFLPSPHLRVEAAD